MRSMVTMLMLASFWMVTAASAGGTRCDKLVEACSMSVVRDIAGAVASECPCDAMKDRGEWRRCARTEIKDAPGDIPKKCKARLKKALRSSPCHLKPSLVVCKQDDRCRLKPSQKCPSASSAGAFVDGATCADWCLGGPLPTTTVTTTSTTTTAPGATTTTTIVPPGVQYVDIAFDWPKFQLLEIQESGDDGDEPTNRVIIVRTRVGLTTSREFRALPPAQQAAALLASTEGVHKPTDHFNGEWHQRTEPYEAPRWHRAPIVLPGIRIISAWEQALDGGIDLVLAIKVAFEADQAGGSQITTCMNQQRDAAVLAVRRLLPLVDLSTFDPHVDLFAQLRPILQELPAAMTQADQELNPGDCRAQVTDGAAQWGIFDFIPDFFTRLLSGRGHDLIGTATTVFLAIDGELASANPVALNCGEFDAGELVESDALATPDQLPPRYSTPCVIDGSRREHWVTVRNWVPAIEGDGSVIPSPFTDLVRNPDIALWRLLLRSGSAETFTNPTLPSGYRLDRCASYAQYCDWPAAVAWCEINGFHDAVSFVLDPNIGATTPTQTIEGGEVCREGHCDGFREIVCIR